MATSIQIDLFDVGLSETELLKKEIISLKESVNKIRKSYHARHDELFKLVIEYREDYIKKIEDLEKKPQV